MMSHRIELTARASRDLASILRELAERSPEAAERLSDRFEAALDRVEANPFTCGLAHESPLVR